MSANTHVPQFTNISYTATLLEYAALNSFVVQVNATDSDLGRNGLVNYAILPEIDSAYFSVDATSGVVTLISSLRSVASNLLVFKVRAYDQGTPRQAATASVHVAITRVRLVSTCDDIVNASVDTFEYFAGCVLVHRYQK